MMEEEESKELKEEIEKREEEKENNEQLITKEQDEVRDALEEQKTEEERTRREGVAEKVKDLSEMEELRNEKMALEEELRLANVALEEEKKKTENERRRRREEVEEKVKEMLVMEMALNAKINEKTTLEKELRDALEEEKKNTTEERMRREEAEQKLNEVLEKEEKLSNGKEEKDEGRDAPEEDKRIDRKEEERREEEVGVKQEMIPEREEKQSAEKEEKIMLEERNEKERMGKEGRKRKRKREETEEKLEEKLERKDKEKQTRAEDEGKYEELLDAMKKQEEKMREIKECNLQLHEFQEVCVDFLRGERVDPAALIEFTKMAGGDNYQTHVAVSLGVPWLVKHVMDKPYRLKTMNKREWTPFRLAAARGDVTIMKLLCQWEEDLETYSPPLLHVAAANRQHSAAEFLLKKVDITATYKRFMAYQVANKVGDDDLAKKIKPLSRTVLSYIASQHPCNPTKQEVDVLLLNPPPCTSVGTVNNTNTSPEPSTRSPCYGATSSTHVPQPTQDGDPCISQDGVRLPKGLPNIGNTCYMNSVLQCLYHTRPLAATLRRLNGDTRQGEVVQATVKVVAALDRRENPRRGVMAQLKRVAGKKDDVYDSFEEQEAHDFLCQMLEWLHEEMARPQQEEEGKDPESESTISELFHGTQQSTITCIQKKWPHVLCNNIETFSNLSLTINHPTTLEEALEQYSRHQELEWECDRCGREHTCQHVVSLTKPPPVLVLHLNRSSRPASSSQKKKVSYSEFLDVKIDNGESRRYSLFAVCCHNGSMSSGHYTAYCRSGDQWYCFNDMSVTSIVQKYVLNKPSAHILFYGNDLNSWVFVPNPLGVD